MLINLRNALMTGKRLPYDAENEYLESTGTQWIDTGIISNGTGLTVEVTCSKTTSSTQEMSIVGRSRSDGFDIYTYNSRFAIWNSSSANSTNPTAVSANEIYNVIGTTVGGTTSITVNGVISSTNRPLTFPLGNIVLFRHNNRYNWVGRIYSCKIYVNGVLVRDFIPVRKGTTGELYDRVSGKFAERHGEFVLGPDVVPVEWLSSDGAQYIDTGYVFQFGDDISTTFQPLATPTQTAYFFGADTAYNAGLNVHYDPRNSNTGLRYCYGGGFGSDNTGATMSPVQAFSASTIYACNGNANKRTINSGENTASVQDSGLNNASVILFCGRRNASVRSASTGWAVASRFFGFDAKRNGVGVRAMKPVRVGTEGAMMDVLTRRIYRNAGTGAFGYGNDLKYPIPAE